MEILSLIQKRRSIRHFKDETIPKEAVEKLLKAARWAPSAGNRQPVEIIIVESASKKEQLAEAALQQRFIEAAPVVFAFCADLDRSSARYGTRGSSLYAIQDAAAATQNVLLMATALGLGTCWIGAFDEKRAAKVLKLPSNVRPLAIVPIGKPARESTAPPRREVSDFTHHEEFGQ
jgi:nitroreductase